jgi:hypothetical protein
MTSTLRGLMRGLAQADARRIREVEAITGQRVTMPSTPSGAGARVRATAKGGKVADTMRAGLRELAQSDARTIREMENIIRGDTPKVAGAKGGKALPGDKKALPEKKTAKPAIRGKGRIELSDRKNVIRNTTGQSKTLNKFNSRPIGTMILDSSYNLVPSPTRVPLRIAGPGSRESDRAYGRVATKRTRALARSRKAKAATAKGSGSLPTRRR